jgi:hypothetical protein
MLEYFDNKIIRKVIAGFGTLFNDIWVEGEPKVVGAD